MGEKTRIAWCNSTMNPWVGCTAVSKGCLNCYAETWDHRMGGDHWGPGKSRKEMSEHYWNQPAKWNREAERLGLKRYVFCGSMMDICDPEAPVAALERLWKTIEATPHLVWMLLTKRPERFLDVIPKALQGAKNIWAGTTVEDQAAADERSDVLVAVPAAARFISVEPLISEVDLWKALGTYGHTGPPCCTEKMGHHLKQGLVGKKHPIDLVIVGAESGRKARLCKLPWVRSIVEQCAAASVPVFVKQLHLEDTRLVEGVAQWRTRLSHDIEEFPENLRVRQWPEGWPRP